MRISGVLAAMALACVPRTFVSPGVVVRIEPSAGGSRSLRTCQILFGWTPEEVTSHCGAPDEVMPWLGHDGGKNCWIYRTWVRPFGPSVTEEQAFAACFALVKHGAPTVTSLAAVGLEVVEVVALDPAQAPEQKSP